MYNTKDVQFVGKHDYDEVRAKRYASFSKMKSFSVNIFKWGLKNNGMRNMWQVGRSRSISHYRSREQKALYQSS